MQFTRDCAYVGAAVAAGGAAVALYTLLTSRRDPPSPPPPTVAAERPSAKPQPIERLSREDLTARVFTPRSSTVTPPTSALRQTPPPGSPSTVPAPDLSESTISEAESNTSEVGYATPSTEFAPPQNQKRRKPRRGRRVRIAADMEQPQRNLATSDTPELLNAEDALHELRQIITSGGDCMTSVPRLLNGRLKRHPALGTLVDGRSLLHECAQHLPQHSAKVFAMVAEAATPAVAADMLHAADSNTNGMTPLHFACMHNHEAIATVAVETVMEFAPEEITVVNDSGWSALHFAAATNKRATIALLCEGHAQLVRSDDEGRRATFVDLTNNRGSTALHLATTSRSIDAASELLQRGADVTLADGFGATALHQAMLGGSDTMLPLAMQLITNGSDVNAQNRDGDTPLHFAQRRGHGRLAALLLQNGCDPLVPNTDGVTAAHLAAGSDDVGMLKLLAGDESVDVAALVAARDSCDRTPLLAAAQMGSACAITQLLELGADLYAVDADGSSALTLAIESGSKNALDALIAADPTIVKKESTMLLALAGNFDHHVGEFNRVLDSPHLEWKHLCARRGDGRTVLHLIADVGNSQAAMETLDAVTSHAPSRDDAVALVQAKDESGATPLHIAASAAHYDVCEQLLGWLHQPPGTGSGDEPAAILNEAAVVQPDAFGLTAMHVAVLGAARNDEASVQRTVMVLLQHNKAAATAPDAKGRRPCDLAPALFQ